MPYPGNESLSADIRDRILETFRQTLDLTGGGSRQEAQLGCDFVLRLDPLFEPARTLQDRLKAGGDDIEVDDLREAIAAAGSEKPTSQAPDPSEMELTDLGAAAEPVAALDSESERRIQQLLDEGRAAFDKVEYQAAIDSWSRIFLIDIDHPEANQRIELARKLKAEVERKIEEALHEGIAQMDRGALDEARQHFNRVLELHPRHRQALEYLDRLDAPPAEPTPAPAPGVPEPEVTAAPQPPPEADLIATPPLVPPAEPPATAEAPPPPTTGRAAGRSAGVQPDTRRRLFLMIGSAVLVFVVVAGWLLLSNWDRMFPNAAAPAADISRPDPIARAQKLLAEGRTSVAVAQLRRLPPDHPSYSEAQALIANWETVPEEQQELGPGEEQLAEHRDLLEEAADAYAGQAYRVAEGLYVRAAAIAPLEETSSSQLSDSRDRLASIQAEIAAFEQGEWTIALRDLWRMHQEAPSDSVVRDLMVDCYYNLGVRDLQRGDTVSAQTQFQEALALLPGDTEVERLMVFSRTYQERPDDLLYRIFVKYLHFR